jgi:hypothetical protein
MLNAMSAAECYAEICPCECLLDCSRSESGWQGWLLTNNCDRS